MSCGLGSRPGPYQQWVSGMDRRQTGTLAENSAAAFLESQAVAWLGVDANGTLHGTLAQ